MQFIVINAYCLICVLFFFFVSNVDFYLIKCKEAVANLAS